MVGVRLDFWFEEWVNSLMIVRSPPTGQRYLHQNRFSPRLMAPTAGTVISSRSDGSSAPAMAPLHRVPIGQSGAPDW